MTVIVTTQVVDNRQDPLPDKVEFVYWKMKGGNNYYVVGSDERVANAVARVQHELNLMNSDDNPAYLEFVIDWKVTPTTLESVPQEAWDSHRVITLKGEFGRIAPESDQVDDLTANAYGTTEPEFSAHDIMWG